MILVLKYLSLIFFGYSLLLAQPIDSTKIAGWEELFFPKIYERLKADKLDTLKNKTLDDNELEIRFWVYPAFEPIDGYILNKSDDKWIGIYVEQSSYFLSPLGDVINAFSLNFFKSEFSKVYGTQNIIPSTGWDHFWEQINEEGILDLPDEDDLNFINGTLDGVGFIVEILNGKNYRTYHYINPMVYDYPECKAMWNLYNIFSKEFN